jgi:hypothetical protein
MMLLLFGALALYAVDAVRELTDGKQAIMLTKKEEVSVLGLFPNGGSSTALHQFTRVCNRLDKKGVATAYSTNSDLWERYGQHESDGPVVLLFRDFDPETGGKKRGKKAPLVLKDVTEQAVSTFIISNALPHVVPLPELSRAGVDANARVGLALQGGMAKMFAFHTDGGPSELLSKLGAANTGSLVVISVDANDEEEKQLMENVGVKESDLDDGTAFFMVAADWSSSVKCPTAGNLAMAQTCVDDFASGALTAASMRDDLPSSSSSSSASSASAPSGSDVISSVDSSAYPTGQVHELTSEVTESLTSSDKFVWLVLETKDTGCAKCDEFEPIFAELAASLKRLKIAKVQSGTESLPKLTLYATGPGPSGSTMLMESEVKASKDIRRMLKKHLKGLAKTDSGAFVRPEPRPKPSSQRNASESKIGSGGSGRGTFKATSPKKNKKKAGAVPKPKTPYYLLWDVHPGYFSNMQKDQITNTVRLARSLTDHGGGRQWSVVLPTLRENAGEGHNQQSVAWGGMYSIDRMREYFNFDHFVEAQEYFDMFGHQVDADLFINSGAADGQSDDSCPADSTTGTDPRFKEGYSIYKPHEVVKKDGKPECMFADKKLLLLSATCAAMRGWTTCEKKLLNKLFDLAGITPGAHEGAAPKPKSIKIGNFNHIGKCKNEEKEDLAAGDNGNDIRSRDAFVTSHHIHDEVAHFIEKKMGGEGERFISVSLQRDDEWREKHEEQYNSEDEIVQAMFDTGVDQDNLFTFFVVTNKKNELIYLRKKLQNKVQDEDSGVCESDGTCPKVELINYRKRSGVKAMQATEVDQVLASKGVVFIGTHNSPQSSAIINLRRPEDNSLPEHDRLLSTGGKLLRLCGSAENPSENCAML